MKPFRTVRSRAIPLPIRDVDTDMIIPAQFLTRTTREGYGDALFHRFKQNDAHFVLNRPEFQGASILIGDENFGCGSSREHAVWALQGAGISVVVAPSFADIFTGNSAKNGLLLVTLPRDVVLSLLERANTAALELEVDLQTQQLSLPGGERYEFPYDAFRRHCLLNGLDDLDYILSKEQELKQYREQRKAQLYFTTTTFNNPR